MKGRHVILAGFLVVGLGASGELRAQAVGEILGTLRDPSGAVVPNGKISAVLRATGLSRSTVSGPEGTYTLPQLPVGTYDVTAEAPGFKSATTSGSSPGCGAS